MSIVDWCLIALVLLSVLLGLVRGMVREIFSLLGWIVGIVLALRFAAPLGLLLPLELPATAKTLIAGAVIVIMSVIVAALLAALLRSLLVAAKLSGADRALGSAFGLVRGVFALAGFVLLASMTALPHQPWWKDSTLLPLLSAGVRSASPYLPAVFSRVTDAAHVQQQSSIA